MKVQPRRISITAIAPISGARRAQPIRHGSRYSPNETLVKLATTMNETTDEITEAPQLPTHCTAGRLTRASRIAFSMRYQGWYVNLDDPTLLAPG